jgi:hypothetical protein
LSSPIGKVFQFSHDHNVGVAYLGEDEEVLLGMVDFELNAFLVPWLVDKWTKGRYVDLFKAQFSYKGRMELFGTTDLDLNSFIDLQLGINIALDEQANNTIGIAYDWIQGANPLEGLADQKYETLTAKVKFKIQ